MKCNIGNSEGRFWRFGGTELFFLSLFLDNAYLRVYLFGSLPFAYELRKGKHKKFILIVVTREVCAHAYWGECVSLMYTRKGDDQQASCRLCNLNPLHPILCALLILFTLSTVGTR